MAVVKITAGVQFQHGVIGDVTGAQRVYIVGDQRAAADKGAAGVRIGAGECERLVAGFHHLAAAADGVVERAAGVQLQRGVIGDVATSQRVNVSGNQRAATDKGATGIRIGSGEGERVVAGFSTRPVPPMLLMKSPPVFSSSTAFVGDVAGTQRLNVSGDQRAAADERAAGVSIAAGKRERLVAGFFHTARTADVIDEVTAGVQFQHGVVGNVATSQRINASGNQRAVVDGGAAGISIAAGKA
ncbi:Uncharacterised protein [Salmonella enterica subsp. enterica]|nr:Uncharacterised protein [Salmonella enterica subsp. enterica] [Salmonella enterica subsp. enterica serovar Menston]